jgi:hypothetical protein
VVWQFVWQDAAHGPIFDAGCARNGARPNLGVFTGDRDGLALRDGV